MAENGRVRVAQITTVAMSLRYLLLNQLLSLDRAGYKVIGISAPGTDVPLLQSAGIPHLAVPFRRQMSPGADLVCLLRLYRILRRQRPMIVHTHTPKPGLLGQLAARLAGVPVVINTLHGFYFHDHMHPLARRLFILFEKIAASCSDVILSQSAEDIQTAIREGICPAEKIKHLGNGIDLARFARDRIPEQDLARTRHELGLSPGCPVVGFVGRLVAEKGLPELLAAVSTITRDVPELSLLIVGPIDHEKPDALTPAVADEYGLTDTCIFTGLRHNMPALYALMDVFVLPSHREGFPRSPMEASAMGVPCVVTDIRGCREAVEHGRNGLLVPLGDVDALAAAIQGLLTDKEEAQRMGAAGRQMAEERFDERRVFEIVQAEYARLLQAKGLPVPAPAVRPPPKEEATHV